METDQIMGPNGPNNGGGGQGFITAQQAKNMCGSIREIYERLLCLKFFLPSFKSSIITNAWLVAVKQKKYPVPKYGMGLGDAPCLKRPPKE